MPTGVVHAVKMDWVTPGDNGTERKEYSVVFHCGEWLGASYCIVFVSISNRAESSFTKHILVEPPASFVFLCTIPFVVIIVLVVGAELNTLVTGPVWHINLITSRQSISSCTYICSKRKSVVILQRERERNTLGCSLNLRFYCIDTYFYFKSNK